MFLDGGTLAVPLDSATGLWGTLPELPASADATPLLSGVSLLDAGGTVA